MLSSLLTRFQPHRPSHSPPTSHFQALGLDISRSFICPILPLDLCMVHSSSSLMSLFKCTSSRKPFLTTRMTTPSCHLNTWVPHVQINVSITNAETLPAFPLLSPVLEQCPYMVNTHAFLEWINEWMYERQRKDEPTYGVTPRHGAGKSFRLCFYKMKGKEGGCRYRKLPETLLASI